jgi:hypothetical protein
MNYLVKVLARSRLLKGDLDLHLVRGPMVLIFLLFGYQKWFEYLPDSDYISGQLLAVDGGYLAQGLPG